MNDLKLHCCVCRMLLFSSMTDVLLGVEAAPASLQYILFLLVLLTAVCFPWMMNVFLSQNIVCCFCSIVSPGVYENNFGRTHFVWQRKLCMRSIEEYYYGEKSLLHRQSERMSDRSKSTCCASKEAVASPSHDGAVR